MNEQLQAELTKIITNINTGAETAWGFITEQTPDIVQQLMLWHGVKSFLLFLFSITIIGITIYANKRQIQYVSKGELWDHPAIMANLFQILLIIPIIESFNITWLQIWIAPKVYLLEYVASMVK